MVAPVAPNPYFIVAPSLYRHSYVSLSRHLAVRTTPLFDSPGCGIKDASHSLAFSYSAPLAQWSWETALRSRHEAHLARFGHGHCFILIRSRPCALPLSQRGVAETRHCFALNSSLIPGSFSAGLRRTTRKHSLATPMSDFFVSRCCEKLGGRKCQESVHTRSWRRHRACKTTGRKSEGQHKGVCTHASAR